MGTTYEPITGFGVIEHSVLTTDKATAPTGIVLRGSDEGLTVTAAGIDAALVAGTYSFIDLEVFQHTGPAEWNVVYVAFNSADWTADLANAAVREEISLQNGVGKTIRVAFSETTPLVTMKYTPKTTSNNIGLRWKYK